MTESTDRKLQERLLLGRRPEGDRLMLGDDILGAALAGTRHLTAGERAALQDSPLTMRRLRALSRQRAAQQRTPWQASAGLLRAASSTSGLTRASTDDGWWSLHFVRAGDGWQVILALDAAAPFAQQLMQERPRLRVNDGGGAVLLEGQLDADGECEARWPFAAAPAEHLQAQGAAFVVEPVR